MGHNRGRLLAADTVRSIKRSIALETPIAAIARANRVGRTTIYRIINGEHTHSLASEAPPLSAQSVAFSGK